jgi:hypothetical protein
MRKTGNDDLSVNTLNKGMQDLMVLKKINPINEAAFDSARSAVKKAAGFIHNTGSPRQAGSPTS